MEHKTAPLPMDGLSNREDLAYFIALQAAGPADTPDRCAQRWDRRAELWERERLGHRKGEERVASAVTYLEQRGLLKRDFAVADIGCGPGRFAAAFAKRVHRVVGLDISEKMVEYGMAHVRREGLENVFLRVCDFQTLDIEKEGYVGAFDLVFSSMTPAVQGIEGLMRAIAMSRGWCCHITHLDGRNFLREQVMREVFGIEPQRQWTGRGFYALFNILFLLGYHPETSYETQRRERQVVPDEDYAALLMEHMPPRLEFSRENAGKILGWLQAHRNGEGLVTEVTDASYGRILWDVHHKTRRPDFCGQERAG